MLEIGRHARLGAHKPRAHDQTCVLRVLGVARVVPRERERGPRVRDLAQILAVRALVDGRVALSVAALPRAPERLARVSKPTGSNQCIESIRY